MVEKMIKARWNERVKRKDVRYFEDVSKSLLFVSASKDEKELLNKFNEREGMLAAQILRLEHRSENMSDFFNKIKHGFHSVDEINDSAIDLHLIALEMQTKIK